MGCKELEKCGNFHEGGCTEPETVGNFIILQFMSDGMQACAILRKISTCGIQLFNACVLYAHCALSVSSSHDNRAAQQAAAGGLLRIAAAFIKRVANF